jgi:hypothetical protein
VGAAAGKVAKIAKMAKVANTVARNGWRHAPTGPMILQTAVVPKVGYGRGRPN